MAKSMLICAHHSLEFLSNSKYWKWYNLIAMVIPGQFWGHRDYNINTQNVGYIFPYQSLIHQNMKGSTHGAHGLWHLVAFFIKEINPSLAKVHWNSMAV